MYKNKFEILDKWKIFKNDSKYQNSILRNENIWPDIDS